MCCTRWLRPERPHLDDASDMSEPGHSSADSEGCERYQVGPELASLWAEISVKSEYRRL